MSVIKCSNCENEILDTEIVCPYCDCPISETLKKMESSDLKSYSFNSVDELTGKIPSIVFDKKPEEKEEYSLEKKAVLKDIDTEKKPHEDEKEHTAKIPVANKEADKTVKISKEDMAKKSLEQKEKNIKAKPAGNKNQKLILGITVAGVIVIILLIWALASAIMGGNGENKPALKPVASDSNVKSDAQKGFKLKGATLTITDNSAMKDYDSPNETPWYEARGKIKHVVFEKGVTKIASHAFEGFEKIQDITMSDSIKLIGESAFCNCTSLEEIIDISKNIEEIDDHAFTGCKKLRKIPGYTEESDFEPTIERIGIEAFKSCKAIEEFKVPMYTEVDTDAFYGHGDKFVLVCETTSNAYDYAIEKGIPTKLGFGDEVPDEEPEDEKNDEQKADTPDTPSNTGETGKKEETSTPDTPQNPPQTQTPQTQAPSLADLMKQLESATTEAEKDRILSEIDKITR